VRSIARWLALAVILEALVQHHVPAQWIRDLAGGNSPASVPLAASVGAPLYFDGYAALPLVRGLVVMGLDVGAALALLGACAAGFVADAPGLQVPGGLSCPIPMPLFWNSLFLIEGILVLEAAVPM
jgi:hypothetical protein